MSTPLYLAKEVKTYDRLAIITYNNKTYKNLIRDIRRRNGNILLSEAMYMVAEDNSIGFCDGDYKRILEAREKNEVKWR